MRTWFSLLLLVLLLGLPAVVFAQQAPSVRGLKPFTAQANYMSLPGFMRMQYFWQHQKWISLEEATQLVKSQQ